LRKVYRVPGLTTWLSQHRFSGLGRLDRLSLLLAFGRLGGYLVRHKPTLDFFKGDAGRLARAAMKARPCALLKLLAAPCRKQDEAILAINLRRPLVLIFYISHASFTSECIQYGSYLISLPKGATALRHDYRFQCAE